MAPKSSIGSLSKMAQSLRAKTAGKPTNSRPSEQAGFKSAEFIQDSDTSSDGSTSGSDSDSEEALAAAKMKLNNKIAVQKNAAVAGSKAKVNGAKKDKHTTATTTQAKSQSTPANKKTIAEEVDTDATSSDSSDSESDSDDEASSTVKPSQVEVAQSKPGSKPGESGKGAEKSSETSSETSSDSESEDGDDVDPMAVARINGIQKTAAGSHTAEITRPAWLNNSDFMLRKAASDNPGKEISDFLSKSNLEGKQVWYFTAPASLPITVLKDMEIDLNKAQSGGALLTHNGDAYGLDLEPYATSTQIQLLIPSNGGEKYTNLNRAIDSTIHLRRVAEFGGGSKINSTATDQYVRKGKAVREQPQNLKPRFTPIGIPTPTPAPVSATKAKSVLDAPAKSKLVEEPKFQSESDNSSDGDSDEEMADAPVLPVSATSTGANKAYPATVANGNPKRKQPVDEDSTGSNTSDSSDSDSSDSDDEPAPVPAHTLKSPEKSTKRAKTEASDDMAKTKFASPSAVPASSTVIPSSQVSKISKAHDVKKSTPVPTPVLGFPTSSLSAPSYTPSKLPNSITKSDKKAKKAGASKPSENEFKKNRETPIPPPKVGLRS